jgi:hypothetical protein
MRRDSKITIDRWCKDNEHCLFGEVLSTIFGNCKYVPSPRTMERPNKDLYQCVPKTCTTFYSFEVDPIKLEEIEYTMVHIYAVISFYDYLFGLVICPSKTFTFELCPSIVDAGPNDNVISQFNEDISTLLKTRIKGIPGVDAIDIKKIKAKDVIAFYHYDEEDDITRLYTVLELLGNDESKTSKSMMHLNISSFQEDGNQRVVHVMTRSIVISICVVLHLISHLNA